MFKKLYVQRIIQSYNDVFNFYNSLLIGASKTENAMELMYARQHVILHAKAFGLQAVDMVYNNYKGNTIY